jgi:hypothetical protein
MKTCFCLVKGIQEILWKASDGFIRVRIRSRTIRMTTRAKIAISRRQMQRLSCYYHSYSSCVRLERLPDGTWPGPVALGELARGEI